MNNPVFTLWYDLHDHRWGAVASIDARKPHEFRTEGTGATPSAAVRNLLRQAEDSVIEALDSIHDGESPRATAPAAQE